MKPPVAIVAETISQHLDDNDGAVCPGGLAHQILKALDLDHTLPVPPNRHLAPWNAA